MVPHGPTEGATVAFMQALTNVHSLHVPSLISTELTGTPLLHSPFYLFPSTKPQSCARIPLFYTSQLQVEFTSW